MYMYSAESAGVSSVTGDVYLVLCVIVMRMFGAVGE